MKMKIMRIVFFFFFLFPLFLSAQEVLLFNEVNSPLIPNDLYCIAVDSSNTKWIGSKGKLYKFDSDWNYIDSVLELTDKYYISDIEIADDGTLWTSMATFLTNTIVTKIYSKSGSRWEKIAYDFGLRDPVNIYPENGNTLYFTLVNNWSNQLGNDAIGVYKDSSVTVIDPETIYGINSAVPLDDNFLLACDWRGVNLFNGVNWQLINPDNWVPKSVKKIKNKIFLFGDKLNEYRNGIYLSYPLPDSLLSAGPFVITSITEEGDDILWLGTNKGKLIKYGNGISSFDISNKPILDIAVDKGGNKWLISKEGCFEFNEDKITKVEKAETIPTGFQLFQNYPNPFNPNTTISYSIPKASFVTLKIFNTLGNEIKTLVSRFQIPKTYSLNFDAHNLSSGIYFYRLYVGNKFAETKKMILLK